MIKLLRRLFGICNHEWEVIEVITVYDHSIGYGNKPSNSLPIGKDYVLQCKKCGDIKIKKLR